MRDERLKRVKPVRIIVLFLLLFAFVFLAALTAWGGKAAAAEIDGKFAVSDIGMSREELHNETYREYYTEETPSLTVFIPGLSGGPAHFSNDFHREDPENTNADLVGSGAFAYNENSLVERMRRTTGQPVLLALGMQNYEYHEEGEYCSYSYGNGPGWCHVCSGTEYIVEFGLAECYASEEYEPYNYSFMDHMYYDEAIIMYEPSPSINGESHAIYDSEIDFIIDRLSYDIKMRTGIIPKVNVIGYSRGGNLAVMYATEHPYNVDSLYTINTPHSGSALADLLINSLGYFGIELSSLPLGGFANLLLGEGANDCMSPEVYNELRDNWNRADTWRINAHAIGCVVDMSYIRSMIVDYFDPNMLGGLIALDEQTIDLIFGAIKLITSQPILTGLLAGGITVFANYLVYNTILGPVLEAWSGVPLHSIANVLRNEVLPFLMQRFEIRDIWGGGLNDVVFLDDVFINIESQLAVGYNGFNQYERYMTADNVDFDDRSSNQLPVAHNLSSKDRVILSYILSTINLQDYNYNDFIYEVNPDGYTCNILGLRPYIDGSFIEIPDNIDGYEVYGIADYAFANINGRYDNTYYIILPESVRHIGAYAFEGMTELQNIESRAWMLETIGEGAFKDCINLSSFFIDDYVHTIHPTAFLNAYNCYLDVSYYNYYMKMSGTLILSRDGTELIMATNNYYSGTIPQGVKYIRPYAFIGNYIDYLDFGEVEHIGMYAFNGCTIRNITRHDSVKIIDKDAFFETVIQGISYQENSDFLVLGSVLLKYSGNREHIYASNFPAGIKTVASGAFSGCSVYEIEFPESVTTINAYAMLGTGVRYVTLHSNVEFIGDMAFASESICINVRLFCSQPPNIGIFPFGFEGIVSIPRSAVEDYNNNELWEPNAYYFDDVKTTVRFSSPGYSDSITAYYGDTITELPDPDARAGYVFDGWFFGSTRYSAGSRWDLVDKTLTAKWILQHYSVSYVLDGGNNDQRNPVSTTVESYLQLYPASKAGFSFKGWYDNQDFEGTQLVSLQGISEDTLLYAKWGEEEFFLYYSIGNNEYEQQVYNGQAFTLPAAPAESGRYFAGWYNAEGVQFTDASGNSIYTYFNKSHDLMPRWEYSFKIRINGDYSITWLGAEGIVHGDTWITIGRDYRCLHCLLDNFAMTVNGQKTGHILDGFTTISGSAAGKINCWDYAGPEFANGAEIDVYPYFVKETYTLKYFYEPNLYESYIIQYGQTFPLYTPSKAGHYLLGWDIVSAQGVDLSELYMTYIPYNTEIAVFDLSPYIALRNSEVILSPRWQAQTYTITIEYYAGYTRYASVTYGDYLYLPSVPARNGYSFNKFLISTSATSSSYSSYQTVYLGTRYRSVDTWTYTAARKIKGDWSLIDYSVDFNSAGGIELQLITFNITTPTFSLPQTEKLGYKFNRWKDAQNVAYTSVVKGTYKNISLTAEWLGKEYSNEYAYSATSIKIFSVNYDSSNMGYIYINLSGVTCNNAVLHIGDTVKELTLQGTENMTFVISIVANASLRINLVDFSMTATGSRPGIQSSFDLTVYAIGKCNIKGGNASVSSGDGSSGITANNLWLTGNAILSITGGNGSQGAAGNTDYTQATDKHGKHGGAGGNAVEVTEITYLQNTGTVKLRGGDGAAGGAGAAGKAGAAGASSTSSSSSVERGENGESAGNGGNGGRGGSAVKSSEVHFIDGYTLLELLGGSGGRGGNGGQGGTGGAGGVDTHRKNNTNAKRGGNGGNGGRGGDGGASGNGGYALEISIGITLRHTTAATLKGGKNGTSGNGGKGGKAGNGGRGGHGIKGVLLWGTQRNGANGGNGGTGGAGGDAGQTDTNGGSALNGTFDQALPSTVVMSSGSAPTGGSGGGGGNGGDGGNGGGYHSTGSAGNGGAKGSGGDGGAGNPAGAAGSEGSAGTKGGDLN